MNKYHSSVAHIVYASDDKFAEILGVSLVSLFENSKDMDEIVVYVFDSGITDDNKQKLLSVCNTYKRSDVVFIPGKNISEKLSMNVAVDRGSSLSQYARLFVSSDLPKELNRVLYLDCDIVVKESIRELRNIDLHGNTIGALMDAFSKHYRKNIDLEPNDIMFNSGVMLIDLEKWRRDEVAEKLLKFIRVRNGRIQQGDQGALNAVLSHDTYCFEP
ncbi:glycosyltransferase family 8 protein [Eisenbergiella sp.]